MATLEELKNIGIDPENKKPGAPDGLKGLSYGERQQLRKQQAQEQQMAQQMNALISKQNTAGAAKNIVLPDIGYTSDLAEPSKFDKALGAYLWKRDEGYSANNMRADLQTNTEFWLNSLVNNIVIAGTTAILDTFSTIDGIIEGLFTGENKFTNNYFNDWSQDLKNWAAREFPMYERKDYQEGSFMQRLGRREFWGNFVSNLGYVEGMLIPGTGAAKLVGKTANALGAGQKVAKTAAGVGGSMFTALGEASEEAKSNMESQKELKTKQLYDTYEEKERLAIENNDQEELYKLYKEKEEALKNIEDDAVSTANYIFWSNVGLLTITNLIEFGSLFGKSYDSGRRALLNKVKLGVTGEKGTLEKIAERDLTKEMIGKIRAVGINRSKEIARVTAKKTADAISEGAEEIMQSIYAHVPEISTDYNTFNESILNPEKKDLVDGFLNGWFKSVTDKFGDKETMTEGMMGFLTGLLGAPTYVRGRGITWGNGIITEIKDAAREGRISRQTADAINDIIQHISTDEKFLARYKGLIRSQTLEDWKNAALELGDKVEYKNAESAQFISDVETFRKAGQIDMFKNMFNTMSDISDEEVEKLIRDTTDENGNGPFSKAGKADNIEEAKNSIKEKAVKYLRNIDRIVDDAEKLESDPYLHAEKLSDDEFNTLLFLKEQGYNFDERVGSMLRELASAFKYGSYDEITEAAKDMLENYSTTVEKNNEKNANLIDYNTKDIEKGVNKRRDVSAVEDYLKGKKEKQALSRDDMRLLDAVISGNYAQYIPQANNTGSFDILDPNDFNRLANILDNNRHKFAKGLETIINSFKDNTIENLILNLPNVINSFAILTQSLNESALNDETAQTLQDIRTLIKDVQRVATASEYYNSEFNRLYDEYAKEAKNRGIRKKVKESVEKAVDKVKTKKKANEIRKAKEAAGEDTTGKTDEEIIEEENTIGNSIETVQAEIASVKEAILNSMPKLSAEEKDRLSGFLDTLEEEVLRDKNIDSLTNAEKIEAYKEVIKALLNHDSYDTISTGLLNDRLKVLKDNIRDLAEKRSMYGKKKQDTSTTTQQPVQTTPQQNEDDQQPENDEEATYEGATEDGVINENVPLDYITNAIPELAWEFRGTKWGYLPADSAPENAVGKEGQTVSDHYKALVGLLRGLGAYEAVSKLLGKKVKRGKVKIHFLMMNTDLHKFGEEENKIPTIYHAVELDEKEDADWIKSHDKNIIEVNGKKYQIIGAQPETVKVNNLPELNEKIRKAAGDPESWKDNKWVSDFSTELVKIIGGRSKIKQVDTKTAEASLSNVLKKSGINPKDAKIGRVTQSSTTKFSIKYMLPDGSVGEAGIGRSGMKSGAVLLLPSANPVKYRYVQLIIPYLSDYLKDPANSNTEYVNKLTDTFEKLINIRLSENPSKDAEKKARRMLHHLIYFGNKEKSDFTSMTISTFDKEDGSVDVKIGFNNPNAQSKDAKDAVIHARALNIQKGLSANEKRELIKNFVLTEFADIITDDRLKTKAGYPLIRISIGYPYGGESFANKASELGLDSASDYIRFAIESNLFKTDISDTAEVGAGYILQKYNPETDKFEEGRDIPKPKKKPAPVRAGVDTAATPTTANGTVGFVDIQSGEASTLNLTLSLDSGNNYLNIEVKSGDKRFKLPHTIFRKDLRQRIENAITTNSALPTLPNIYTATFNKKQYLATYGENGKLTIVDSVSGEVLRWETDEGKDIYNFFDEEINSTHATEESSQGEEKIETNGTVKYTPIGKTEQTYTIRGTHIYNKSGKEVFKEDTKDRRKIFGIFKLQNGDAVPVMHKGILYIVDKNNEILSMSKTGSGDIMQWPENNGDRKAILSMANKLFEEKNNKPESQPKPEQKKEEQTPTRFGNDAASKFTAGLQEVGENPETETPEPDFSDIPENEKKLVYKSVDLQIRNYKKAIDMGKNQGQGESYFKAVEEGILRNAEEEAYNELGWEPKHFALFKQVFKDRVKAINAEERGKRYNKAEKKAKIEKELSWLNRVLPKAQVERVKQGFVKLLSDPDGLYVGKFMNNAIYIAEQFATRGTVYHEAFHFVFNSLLTDKEQETILKAAEKFVGANKSAVEKEEWLADNFSDYIGRKNAPFFRRIGYAIIDFFEKFAAFVGIINSNRAELRKLYNDINKGLYANREIIRTSTEEKGKSADNKTLFDAMKNRFDALSGIYNYKVKYSDNPEYKFILQFTSPEAANNARGNLAREFRGIPVSWDFLNLGNKYGLGVKFEAEKPASALETMSEQKMQTLRKDAMAIAKRKGEDISDVAEEMSEDALETYIHCR